MEHLSKRPVLTFFIDFSFQSRLCSYYKIKQRRSIIDDLVNAFNIKRTYLMMYAEIRRYPARVRAKREPILNSHSPTDYSQYPYKIQQCQEGCLISQHPSFWISGSHSSATTCLNWVLLITNTSNRPHWSVLTSKQYSYPEYGRLKVRTAVIIYHLGRGSHPVRRPGATFQYLLVSSTVSSAKWPPLT